MPDYNTRNNRMSTIVTVSNVLWSPPLYQTKIFDCDKDAYDWIISVKHVAAVEMLEHLLTIDEANINY